MKSRTLILVAAMTLLIVLAIPLRLAAQEQQQMKQLPRYTVIDLGTLGGAFSDGQSINNKGWVTGTAQLSGNTAQHGFLWQEGVKTDLGSLGGPNSGAGFVGGLNDRGQAVGHAETSTPDPLGEDFCFFGTHLVCLPFLWQDGVMTPLPTLGGNNGAANGVNNQGRVVGSAENATLDSTCPSPELEVEPAVWENGKIQQLPAFPGDPDGFANAINDTGLVVGASGDCSTGNASSLHALLWRGGRATNLGSLGGTLSNNAFGVNDQGQVTGASDLPGDTNFFAGPGSTSHAFLWHNGVMSDLGTLPGDAQSVGFGINNKGQVVGGFTSRAYIWQNGVMTDLNTLVPGLPFSPLYLLGAESINDRGEIAGIGLAITGEEHAFLAIPCDEDHRDVEGCQDNAGAALAADTTEGPSVSESPTSVAPDNWTPGLRRIPGLRGVPLRRRPRGAEIPRTR